MRAVVDAANDAVCVGITVLTGAPIHDALAVSRAVKAKHRDCPVIWGGWTRRLSPMSASASHP